MDTDDLGMIPINEFAHTNAKLDVIFVAIPQGGMEPARGFIVVHIFVQVAPRSMSSRSGWW
jgi:hypothetical protein